MRQRSLDHEIFILVLEGNHSNPEVSIVCSWLLSKQRCIFHSLESLQQSLLDSFLMSFVLSPAVSFSSSWLFSKPSLPAFCELPKVGSVSLPCWMILNTFWYSVTNADLFCSLYSWKINKLEKEGRKDISGRRLDTKKDTEARSTVLWGTKKIGNNSVLDKEQHAKVEKLSRIKAGGYCILC